MCHDHGLWLTQPCVRGVKKKEADKLVKVGKCSTFKSVKSALRLPSTELAAHRGTWCWLPHACPAPVVYRTPSSTLLDLRLFPWFFSVLPTAPVSSSMNSTVIHSVCFPSNLLWAQVLRWSIDKCDPQFCLSQFYLRVCLLLETCFHIAQAGFEVTSKPRTVSSSWLSCSHCHIAEITGMCHQIKFSEVPGIKPRTSSLLGS